MLLAIKSKSKNYLFSINKHSQQQQQLQQNHRQRHELPKSLEGKGKYETSSLQKCGACEQPAFHALLWLHNVKAPQAKEQLLTSWNSMLGSIFSLRVVLSARSHITTASPKNAASFGASDFVLHVKYSISSARMDDALAFRFSFLFSPVLGRHHSLFFHFGN
jgi:hypothetical protein